MKICSDTLPRRVSVSSAQLGQGWVPGQGMKLQLDAPIQPCVCKMLLSPCVLRGVPKFGHQPPQRDRLAVPHSQDPKPKALRPCCDTKKQDQGQCSKLNLPHTTFLYSSQRPRKEKHLNHRPYNQQFNQPHHRVNEFSQQAAVENETQGRDGQEEIVCMK